MLYIFNQPILCNEYGTQQIILFRCELITFRHDLTVILWLIRIKITARIFIAYNCHLLVSLLKNRYSRIDILFKWYALSYTGNDLLLIKDQRNITIYFMYLSNSFCHIYDAALFKSSEKSFSYFWQLTGEIITHL